LALLQAERSQWIVAVLFIDLDRFKIVNDTKGHLAGDLLLQQAAQRIASCLHSTDTVARLCGDEFGVILPDLGSERDVSLTANRIMESLAEPFRINGHEHFVTSSIGIALYPSDARVPDALVSCVDTAMYRAKELGRSNYQFFTVKLNDLMMKRAKLESGLRKALERNELFLHYQPQVDIETGWITGVEALMRWTHPEFGMVPPDVFIPLAEETGLIVPIGEWALRTACAQNKAWQNAGIPPIVISVNVSARQFKGNDMDSLVQRVLEETGLASQYLDLELTEGAVLENAEALIGMLKRLKKLGVQLSIDDFGTGYSNLSYFRRFALDVIKIDRSFVSSIGCSEVDDAIAAAVINFGHSLKLQVIAEGVETEEQLAFLRAHGCDTMQGKLFSRPLPAHELTELLYSSFFD
jgi:diguanylate cyclase (GGDEF)-like protein